MLRVVYKGGILEPVRSGGIHGLLGSVGTELVDVVLGNPGRCSCRLYGVVGMAGKTGYQPTLPCARRLACCTVSILDSNKGTRFAGCTNCLRTAVPRMTT